MSKQVVLSLAHVVTVCFILFCFFQLFYAVFFCSFYAMLFFPVVVFFSSSNYFYAMMFIYSCFYAVLFIYTVVFISSDKLEIIDFILKHADVHLFCLGLFCE